MAEGARGENGGTETGELSPLRPRAAERPGEDDEAAHEQGGGGRPILRGDVYRHPIVGGRERPETRVRAALRWLQAALTSRGEREESELDERLRRPAPVSRPNVIAVVSPKGGVGKTTGTWLIGDALARLGRVNVCAVDANPDYGTLGALVPDARRSDRTLSDLLDSFRDAGTDALPGAAELRPFLSATEAGLRVLRAPLDPTVMGQMQPSDYERLLALLSPQMEVVLLDCGTGLASDLAVWAQGRADQVMIVTTPDWVTANNVSSALRSVPARRPTLIVNQVRSGAAGDRRAITDHFARQAVERRFALPYDENLRTMLDSGTYELDALGRRTRLAIKRLVAQVGDELQ